MNADAREVEIRAALEADCEAILESLGQLAAELGESARFRCRGDDLRAHGFGAGALFRCLLATQATRQVGLALYFPLFSTLRGQPGVYLQDLWVARGWRDSGLGTRLLREVAHRAAHDWGAGYLELTVHDHNAAAERFYRRHGLRDFPRDRHLSIDGDGFGALAAK